MSRWSILAAAVCVVVASGSASAADSRNPLPGRPPARGQATAPSAAAKPVEARPSALVTGFRSARFGMTESEVRAAIATDFPAHADTIAVEVNAVERTTVLTLSVPGLLPDAGLARVGYVLGYKNRTLIQVQVVWGRPIDAAPVADSLVATARLLENHLNEAGFAPENVVAEAELPNGDILVFRGVDSGGRMTTLILSGDVDTVEGKRRMTPTTLRLSYILDPKKPDVFRLDRGAF